jgi:hypothetical protein
LAGPDFLIEPRRLPEAAQVIAQTARELLAIFSPVRDEHLRHGLFYLTGRRIAPDGSGDFTPAPRDDNRD